MIIVRVTLEGGGNFSLHLIRFIKKGIVVRFPMLFYP
jgi:hypothetical protein